MMATRSNLSLNRFAMMTTMANRNFFVTMPRLNDATAMSSATSPTLMSGYSKDEVIFSI